MLSPVRVTALLAALLLLAACGGSPVMENGSSADDQTAAEDPIEGEVDPGDGEAAPDAVDEPTDDDGPASAETGAVDFTDEETGVATSSELGVPPAIEVPGGEPPAELVIIDVVEGDGPEVEPGAEVTIHYTGVSWLNEGAEFDSSWVRGEPATFPLDGLIAGWQEGIPGMQPGGRRMLIIPPDLGYGDTSPSPDIAASDTLVFVIDLQE